jgi:predicted TIM-barrel fold metal-dependent hydrolase
MHDPDELILISVDDHICEPPDMFARHVPARYSELAPRVVEEANGAQQWWYGDIKGRTVGLNATAGKPPEYFNVDAYRYDEMRPGCFDVHERVRDMNAGGVLAGLNFPNFTGFSGQVLNLGPDPDVNEVMIRAYNDWHLDDWAGAYPGRFIPCGLLPLFDVERAAAEVRRLASRGCHAVTFSENPEGLGMPSLHTDHWDPLFAACCDEGTVLCCHLGSSSRTMAISPDSPPSVPLTLSPGMTVSTFGEMLWATFWDRFPALRISLTEGDVGWMPYFLWRAEHVDERHGAWIRLGSNSARTSPREIFWERILCCFIDDGIFPEMAGRFNLANVCWESDFPHSDGLWPDAPEVVASLLADLDPDVVAGITHLNAMRHYQFDPFQHRSPAECTVASLRRESPDVKLLTLAGRVASERDHETWKNLQAGRRKTQAASREAELRAYEGRSLTGMRFESRPPEW